MSMQNGFWRRLARLFFFPRGKAEQIGVAAGESQWAALRNRLDDRLRTLAATTSQRNRRSKRKKG